MSYGILCGNILHTFKNATRIEHVISTFIKKSIEDMDHIEIKEDELPQAVQKSLNEYGEYMMEINDDAFTVIVTAEDFADHLSNQMWIVHDRITVDNKQVCDAIVEWMKRNDIKDYYHIL